MQVLYIFASLKIFFQYREEKMRNGGGKRGEKRGGEEEREEMQVFISLHGIQP